MCANAYPFPPQKPAVYMFPITLSLLTILLNLLPSFLRGTYKKKQLPFSATHTIAPKYSTSSLIEESLKGGGIEIEPMGVYVCVCISVCHLLLFLDNHHWQYAAWSPHTFRFVGSLTNTSQPHITCLPFIQPSLSPFSS